MATVESWFWDWLDRHTDRVRRADWPKVDAEFWAVLASAFVRLGVTEAVADDASAALALEPPQFLDRHHEALLIQVRLVWAAAEVSEGTGGGRDAASRASRHCAECDGHGLTSRRMPPTETARYGYSATFYCHRCPMGRWMEQEHREKAPDVHARIRDLIKHPALWGGEAREATARQAIEALPPGTLPASLPDPSAARDRLKPLAGPIPNVALGPDGKAYTVPVGGIKPWARQLEHGDDAPAF